MQATLKDNEISRTARMGIRIDVGLSTHRYLESYNVAVNVDGEGYELSISEVNVA